MTTKLQNLKRQLKEEKLRDAAPEWMHWTGYQLLREKGYLDDNETIHSRFLSIASTAADHLPDKICIEYQQKFYDLMWQGKLSPATPVYTNMGKPYKGMPISCSGSYVDDSINGFYDTAKEVANLSKNGFGTSAYMSDIRPRGTGISAGGEAEGVIPVMELLFNTTKSVSQSSSRRGSIACYVNIDHEDFDEVCRWVVNNRDGSHIGWCITDNFIERYFANEPEAIRRFQEIIYLRMLGKGYILFTDRVNRQNPRVYKDRGIQVLASNLCSEIALHSSEEYSFTCCLSSLNLSRWDEITPDDIKTAIYFLDCVNSEFIEQGKLKVGLEKAVRFAEWSRPIGLGAMGLGTYFQKKGVAFGSIQSRAMNRKIFKTISESAHKANRELAALLGESELMEGTGLRMSHTMAIAPTMSTALIMGGVSNGIEPVFAAVYTQESAGGDIRRAPPEVYRILKERGQWKPEVLKSCIDNEGSVQHLDCLTKDEKLVLRTAFEIPQTDILQMAENRAPFIDQAQSVNVFFNALATEQEVGDLHRAAFRMKHLKSLYYVRSIDADKSVNKHNQECTACEG